MTDFIEKLWSVIKGEAVKEAAHHTIAPIPKERTDLADSIDVIRPHRDYFRIWMNQMFLANETEWFTDLYPAVHTSVQLRFAGQTVKLGHVTGPDQEHTRGAKLDYAVTSLIPFSGGEVEVASGLIALKGTNKITAAIGILQDFSSLIAPPLAQALGVARTVSSGMDKLIRANDGEVRLPFHREFVAQGGGGQELKPGYFAVIDRTGIDESKLSVRDGQLYYGNSPAQPTGWNYMLFRIEGRSERDDWRFPNIEQAMQQAIEAGLKGKTEDLKGYKLAATLAVWASPDLAPQDKRRVVDVVEQEIAAATGGGKGAVAGEIRSLDEAFKARAMPLAQALRQPPLTYEELLSR
jgi:hypothetical protein